MLSQGYIGEHRPKDNSGWNFLVRVLKISGKRALNLMIASQYMGNAPKIEARQLSVDSESHIFGRSASKFENEIMENLSSLSLLFRMH